MSDDADDRGSVAAIDADSGPPDPAAAEVPEDLARTFWTVVGLSNVALFAASLGLMLLVFRGRAVAGGASLLVGLAALALALRRYRRHNA